MDIRTPRGVYLLGTIAAPERTDNAQVITISLDRADGIERFAFRCSIADDLTAGRASAEIELNDLAGWITGNFENIRESALRSLRNEHRVWEARFDWANPGPFKPAAGEKE